MIRTRAGVTAVLAAAVLLAVAAPTSGATTGATTGATPPPMTNTYERAATGFDGDLGAGFAIGAIVDAVNFTDNGQPATTAAVHAEINGDGIGLYCDADGPASLQIADDLNSAALSTSLEGACTDVLTFETHPFTVQVEIAATGSAALQRRTDVITTDAGAMCRQHFSARSADATGTAIVAVPTLGIEAALEVGPAPYHRLERVEELCVTPGDR